MNEFFLLALSFILGVGLGFFYFGGLWLTVRRLPQVSWPGLLTFGSLFGRTALLLFAFYLLARSGHWERIVVCLLGLICMRMTLVRRWRPVQTNKKSSTEGE